MVQSGASDVFALGDLAQAASVRGRGVGVALVRVPAELLSSGHRGVGDPDRLFREAPMPRGPARALLKVLEQAPAAACAALGKAR